MHAFERFGRWANLGARLAELRHGEVVAEARALLAHVAR